MNFKEFITGYKGKDIPPELKEFNWGAFLLTFIWGIPHKAWITLLAIPLIWFQLPFGSNWLLLTILQVYSGIKGNEWAYQVHWWKKPRDFRITQTKWAVAAFALNFIIPAALIFLTLKFIQKSPDNPQKLIENTLCTVAHNKVEKGIKNISINSTTSQNQIAIALSKQIKDTKADGSSLYFYKKDNNTQNKFYVLNISKYGENCRLGDRNCQMEGAVVIGEGLTDYSHCSFFFDNAKNIVPDTETSENLKKGYNIFKYL